QASYPLSAWTVSGRQHRRTDGLRTAGTSSSSPSKTTWGNHLPQLVGDEFLNKGRGHGRELCHASRQERNDVQASARGWAEGADRSGLSEGFRCAVTVARAVPVGSHQSDSSPVTVTASRGVPACA